MAVKQSAHSGLHLLVRLIGITGFLAIPLGLFWKLVVDDSWAMAHGLPHPEVGWIVALAGAGAVALALMFEMRAAFRFFISGRGAVGSNVLLQLGLAVALLVGANLFSFAHYQRFDWTENHAFTLREDLREQLAKLKTGTDIVVFLRHATAGVSGESTEDYYDAAAERKIVEKIKDLAEQFQELGPRFRVQVLDLKKKDYRSKFEQIERESKSLADAIASAPENSIFFQAHGTEDVQRLAFHDIYQLDRQASMGDKTRESNLVLMSQGVGAFARKVLNIEEKRPRIAVAVVHEVLGLDADKDLGMPGVKKALASRGLDHLDIILKTWKMAPEPTVLTHAENAYEEIEGQLKLVEADIKEQQEQIEFLAKREKSWQDKTLAEINALYAVVDTDLGTIFVERARIEQLRKQGRKVSAADVTEQFREMYVDVLQKKKAAIRMELDESESSRTKLVLEKSKLNIENLAEQRRITDLRAKFKRMLAEADLLMVPRLTMVNLIKGERIPFRAHGIDPAQVEAIKDYLKSGRPALFCLGPANEPRGDEANPDELESLLASLGIQMPNQTILYNAEGQALAQRNVVRDLPKVPDPSPVNLDWQPGAVLGNELPASEIPVEFNPIRVSLKLAGRTMPQNSPGALRIRQPRPVYYLGSKGKLDESTVFLVTASDSWNEDQPFGSPKGAPKYQAPKPDDPDTGTIREKRHGPFPIGVAVETQVPEAWYKETEKPADRPKVRVAVIGSGGVFLGENLTPLQEKVLLDTTNWLLRRDDLLAHKDQAPWSYPRVDISEGAITLWTWAAVLGLPLLFVYFGVMILLVRGLR